ncbi:matrixin family metalloprotease [Cellulomonas algicola]|uniref:matrixin family metalloprotease n=1 Tax=Cellulomonas algicola TaxID=2071633 RepID=UPI001C3F8D90|nr:matrixin family metalloprotease [Cellulomonas algicola]
MSARDAAAPPTWVSAPTPPRSYGPPPPDLDAGAWPSTAAAPETAHHAFAPHPLTAPPPDPRTAWTGPPPGAWAGGGPPLPPTLGPGPVGVPHRGRASALVAAVVVVATLVSGATWWVNDQVARLSPPAGHEEAAVPLGTPPLASALDAGPHTFTAMQPDGSGPVTYSPCRPIHYVVRPDNAPPGGDVLIRTAVQRVAEATGLQFVDDGATTEGPTSDRPAYQPDRYGRRWAPVLFTWSTSVETPGLLGDVAGTGGSASVTFGGRSVYVTGEVTLDTEELAPLVATPDGTAVAIGVVTHELAHVVGLGHVDDPTQLMYPSTNLTVTSFAAGDRAGLAALGRGACAPDV